MALKALRVFIGKIFNKNASTISYDASTEGLIYNNNDSELRAHIGGADRKLSTDSGSDTFTNKSIDADNNTITNIDNDEIKAGAGIDASKIADGSVSNTEYQYLDGVTSAIQTQLDAKVDESGGTLTGGSVVDSTVDFNTASNTSKLVLPQDTKTNLDALTREEGRFYYANDEDSLYYDDGSTLLSVGGSSSGAAGEVQYSNGTGGFNSSTDLVFDTATSRLLTGNGTSGLADIGGGSIITYRNSIAQFGMVYAKGDITSPTQTLVTDNMSQVYTQGYDNVGNLGLASQILTIANENWTATNRGTNLAFRWSLNGTATPASYCTFSSASSKPTLDFGIGSEYFTWTGTELRVYSGDDFARIQQGFVANFRYGNTPGVNGVRYNGTAASPTAIVSGNVINTFGSLGYDGSTLATGAAINMVATENWSGTNRGTEMDFDWALQGSASPSTYMSLGTNAASKPEILFGENLSSVSSANTIQTRMNSGDNRIESVSGSIANGQGVGLQSRTLTPTRRVSIFVTKHANITNPAGSLVLSQENGTDQYYWSDNVGNFRQSTNPTHPGTTNGTVVGTQTSDQRVKTDIQDLPYGLSEIMQLETKRFKMIDDEDGTNKLGFIAQQAISILPETVYDTKEDVDGSENTKLAMDYSQIIPVLVKAIQELKAEIETLKGN